MEHQYIQTNEITLHVVQAGPVDGPLIILLHGFPGFWYGWRPQIEYLAAAGFRVWAPDLRGYNLSDKPRGAAAYSLDHVGDDVVGLIDAAGRRQAILVGHDWGGGAAWWTALNRPERVASLVIINIPHPGALGRVIWRRPDQLLRSLYVLFFQIPWLPEWLLRARNDWLLRRGLRATSRPTAFDAADIAAYRRAWSRPRALTSMLNWYRSLSREGPPIPVQQRVTQPVLLLWGRRDPFLVSELATASLGFCDDARLLYFNRATHWLHREERERVSQLIVQFNQDVITASSEMQRATKPLGHFR